MSFPPYKILMIGPQGSGKGTQAQILSDKLGIPIFSTGNILRQRIQTEDELGLELKNIINSGDLVLDDLVNKMITEKIEKDGKDGYILDGYPRNIDQAKFLDNQDELTYVFEIDITDDEAIRRIGGRRTCPKCQTVYHIEYNPPIKNNICDKDGEKLVIREDEKESALKQRLKNYHDLTKPILDYYNKKNILHKIDGEKPIPEVAKDVSEVI